MTRRQNPPRLSVEQLEDRLTPAGTKVPAGEFNWTQYSPTGTLGQLIWNGQALIYRTRAGGTWQPEVVAVSDDYTRPQYNSRDQMQAAAQTAQLVYTANGTAHAFFLEKQYDWVTRSFTTLIRHHARTAGGWQRVETIVPPWRTAWGPNNLLAEAGPGNSLHLAFTETRVAATGVGQFGSGTLAYATNKSGRWAFQQVAVTADLNWDVWFRGGRYAPRFLSLAVDAQGHAHVTFTPRFYISGAFGEVRSNLKYATNKSGTWATEAVMRSLDGTGDAGLGASVAVAPNGTVAVASYYVDRYTTGSPVTSWLVYSTRGAAGGWTNTRAVSRPDGYVAGDGPLFTGFAPQLSFDPQSRPTIVFSDAAGEHLPVTYANEFAGQIRTATLVNGSWVTSTVYRQTNPLVNQLLFPVATTFNGRTVYAGLRATSTLRADKNPTRVDYALVDVNAPTAAPLAAPAPKPLVQPAAALEPVLVAGTEAGVVTVVRVTFSDGSYYGWTPFGLSRGGAAVARGDVNGDGVDDVIAASGPGMAGRVRVYDMTTRRLIGDYAPFGSFAGGLAVAVGDVTGDGRADIVVGAARNRSPVVAVIDGATGRVVRQFLAYPAGFTAGVRLGVGDVNNDGFADVVVGPGGGPNRYIRVFDGESLLPGHAPEMVTRFLSFGPGYAGALGLAVGDLDGDGHADVTVGTEVGSSRFQVFGGAGIAAGEPEAAFLQTAWPGRGVRLGLAADTDGDDLPELVVTAIRGETTARFSSSRLGESGWAPADADFFDPLPEFGSGVYVG